MMQKIFSPVVAGLILTLIFVKVTFDFYGSRSNIDQLGTLSSVLQAAHKKSIDYRLQVRGPKPVSQNLAMLAMDEETLRTLGQWPLPRDLISEAVQRAIQHGAKVVAMDIVWSEGRPQPEQKLYQSLQADLEKNKYLHAKALDQLQKLDADATLARMVAANAGKIVMGAFSLEDAKHPIWNELVDYCLDYEFKLSGAYPIWNQEESFIAVTDSLSHTLPTAAENVLTKELTKIKAFKKNTFDFCIDWANNSTVLNEISKEWSEENQTFEQWQSDTSDKYLINGITNVSGWVMNLPKVGAGTKHTGFLNTDIDDDGVIRFKKLISRTGHQFFPSLALKAYLVATNRNANVVMDYNAGSFQKEVSKFEILDNDSGNVVETIPADGQGRILLNYAGPQQMFPYVSLSDLLNSSPNILIKQRVKEKNSWVVKDFSMKKTDFFKDKILVLGATATGINDIRSTPFDEHMPGPETHLTVLENIISKRYLVPLPNEAPYMILFILGLGTFLTIVLSYMGALTSMGISIILAVAMVFIDKNYIFGNGYVATIILPMLLIIILYVALTSYRYLTEERGKKELKQTFAKYVSPAIVNEILADPKNIELGGRKTNLTIFFSDVRGFTTISEKLDPRALSDLLNSYLTPMTEIVFKNHGTLDKYMGDAIMAFFGAPLPEKNHAEHACRCALQSIEKLKELQAAFEKKGLPSIDIGIGLNTGDVSVGNMGSNTVRSYTVMGDAVNLASRLEGINKQYGTRIILSQFTKAAIGSNFICRVADLVRVKGKLEPVMIYELIAEGKMPQNWADLLPLYNEGLELYRQKQWAAATEKFNAALKIMPNDELSKLYMTRCQEYIDEPPPQDWDGVFVMKTK